MKIYVPADTFAVGLGADALARALERAVSERGLEAQVIRTGSRGLAWLEPLVEVERDAARTAYATVSAKDVTALLDGTLADLGAIEEHPLFARQTRVTFARCGLIDPLDLEAYAAHGGLVGLRKALALAPREIVDEVTASGLRGRGGAGFPTGIKWATVAGAPGPRKHIVCNADEGDSGTFADRMLIEGDPFTLIEGMVIAGLAVGAEEGVIYLRSEYPLAIRVLRQALVIAEKNHLIGADVLGSGRRFSLTLRIGAGAYICGEETALLNSLEGKRGTVRAKPPLPALEGLFGRPTVVNNVLTLATIPAILGQGAAAYAAHGLGKSRGTVTLQLAGNVQRGGLFEVAFGTTLREVIENFGGGTASGRPVKAAQVGGPLGAYLRPDQFDVPLGYEELDAIGGLIGHAGVVVFDDTADMSALARFAMEFCAVESCGKCTPCRIGSRRGVETIDRLRGGDRRAEPLLRDLCETLRDGSLCALGGFTPYPVLSALDGWPEDFAPQAQEAAE